MTLYIVRHGQTEENQQQILQGHLPGVLTDEGRAQMVRTAERLQQMDVEFNRLVCSDLRRTVDSAEIIGERLKMRAEPMMMLRERDWGSFTGMSVSVAKEKFYKEGRWEFPMTEHPVESEQQMMERARNVLDELKRLYDDENIIVVTHGMFSRCMIAARFGCEFREVTPLVNAEVRTLILTSDK